MMLISKRLALAGVAFVLLSVGHAGAAVLGGNSLEIGWTGGTAFGAYVNNGAGIASGVYAVPASGYSTAFSTAPYASSTGTSTAVSDTNINITNSAFAGWVPPQWFQYVDTNNTLPDFRNMIFTLDSANTTVPGFDLATRLQVQENAFAIEFGEIAPGQAISINVAVPEPAGLSLLAASALLCLVRRRR